MAEESKHQPLRPTWECRSCGAEWPCRSRRDELVEEVEGSRVRLALVMATYFHQAMEDAPKVAPRELYARFMIWPQAPVHARPKAIWEQ